MDIGQPKEGYRQSENAAMTMFKEMFPDKDGPPTRSSSDLDTTFDDFSSSKKSTVTSTVSKGTASGQVSPLTVDEDVMQACSFPNKTPWMSSKGVSMVEGDDFWKRKLSLYSQKEQIYHPINRKAYTALEAFCTGSSYYGNWDRLGKNGYGVYLFPHGVVYKGNFQCGEFHGKGTLEFPRGQKIEGAFVNGRLLSFKYVSKSGLRYDAETYCKIPDRRFQVDMEEGLQPAPGEFLTNPQPTRKIPHNNYDTGDGFYDPMLKSIISPYEPRVEDKIIRVTPTLNLVCRIDDFFADTSTFLNFKAMPRPEEEAWIFKNCRRAEDAPQLFRPDLYEMWITGRNVNLIGLDRHLKAETFEEHEDLLQILTEMKLKDYELALAVPILWRRKALKHD